MKIIICGCFGKMGQTVFNIASNIKEFEIVGSIDRNIKKLENFVKNSCNLNNKIKLFKDASEINIKCDVIIDFSSPDALENLIKSAIKNKISLVLCTTGYSEIQKKLIKKASEKIAIFTSENTSIAVNLILELAKISKKILKNFDIEIIEKHHNKKIDAPSGTALMLANALSDEDTELVYNRTGAKNKRKNNEIGVYSIRAGDIKGEHEILFAGSGEIVSIKHLAETRNIFANGALKAAKFVISKSSGIYNMSDLISICKA